MFALLETETMPRPNGLERLRAWARRESGVALREQLRWGTRVLHVRVVHTLGESAQRREARLSHAFRMIAQRNVRAVVLPKEMRAGGLPGGSSRDRPWEGYGITVADPMSLYRRMAPALCRFAADAMKKEPRQLGLAVCARRMTSELTATVQALSLRARSIALCVPHGTGAAAGVLRAQYGVSVLENPSPEQLPDTDIYLVFDSAQAVRSIRPRPGSLVLWLDRDEPPEEDGAPVRGSSGCRHCDGALLQPPARLEGMADADRDALLTVLLALGAVGVQEIAVRALLWNGRALEF